MKLLSFIFKFIIVLLFSILTTTKLNAQKKETYQKILGNWQQTQVVFNPNSKEQIIEKSEGFTLTIKENGTFIKKVQDSEVPIVGQWNLVIKEDQNKTALYFKSATNLGLIAGLYESDRIIKLDTAFLILEQELNEDNKTYFTHYYYKRKIQKPVKKTITKTTIPAKDIVMSALRDSILPPVKLEVFANTLLKYLQSTAIKNLDSILFSKADIMNLFSEKLASSKGEEKENLQNEITAFYDNNTSRIHAKFYEAEKKIFNQQATKINRSSLKTIHTYIVDIIFPKTQHPKRGNRYKIVVVFSDDNHYIIFKFDDVLLWLDKLIISGDRVSFWHIKDSLSYAKGILHFDALEKKNLQELKN